MRGKTNVGGGNGIFVDGDIDYYTVAEGNSITAGDYVSRKIIPKYQEVLSGDSAVYGNDKVGDNLYLCQIGDYLRLINYDGDIINIVRSYTDYAIVNNCYYYDSESQIIWAVVKDESVLANDSGYIVQLQIEENRILLLNKYTNEKAVASPACYAIGNKFITVSISTNVYYNIYEISQGQITWNRNKTDIIGGKTNSSTGRFESYITLLNRCGNRYYYINSRTEKKELYYFEFHDTFEDFVYKKINTFGTSTTYPKLGISKIIEKDGEDLFFAYGIQSGNTISYKTFHQNMISGVTEEKTFYELGITPYNSNPSYSTAMQISDFFEENKFILCIDGNFYVLKFDEITASIQKYSNAVEVPSVSKAGISLINGNDIAFNIGNGSKFVMLKSENTTLLSNEEQKIAEAYNKEIGAIGLAKNSGSAGEVIAVLVPPEQ